jgi:hypothetical protein
MVDVPSLNYNSLQQWLQKFSRNPENSKLLALGGWLEASSLVDDPQIWDSTIQNSGFWDFCTPGVQYILFHAILYVCTLVSFLMATSHSARVVETFLKGPLFNPSQQNLPWYDCDSGAVKGREQESERSCCNIIVYTQASLIES